MNNHEIAEGLIGHFGPDSLSEKQFQLLSFIAGGGAPSAATHIYSDPANARTAFRKIKQGAAESGFAPEHDFVRPVPDGFVAKGVSTYYNKEGKPTGQWVKASIDGARQDEMLRAAVAAMCDEITPVRATPPPKSVIDDLANVYTFTDCHVGMLAWHKEGGDDWDLGIAENTLTKCFASMIENSPQASTAIVNQLGDFMHFDGLVAETPTHGHPLDADGRFGKIVEIAIRTLRRIIDLALEKHAHVHVIMAEGNHDLVSSIWLRKMFAALYENEPRVSVDDSELPYYVYEHGETMLAFHHGHLTKNDKLPLLFASQFPKVWGNTTKRYAHCGHRHHLEDKDHNGMRVTQHPTLAARDAYAARGGWVTGREATSITYHKQFGKVGEATICPEMLQVA